MALHRPYIRADVRAEVERRAEKNENGQFLDANTGKPIEGQYDLGHKAGHEHWREAEKAEQEGLSQEEFNDRMNNPDLYQIEDPHENRSHAHEMPAEETADESVEGTDKALDGSETTDNSPPPESTAEDVSDAEGESEDCGQEM